MIKFYLIIISFLFCSQFNNLYAKSNEKSKVDINKAQNVIDAQGNCSTFVTIKTSMGTIEVMLYDITPLHKENFLKLVQSRAYPGMLFHRVINEFMIQSGDPLSKEALSTSAYGKNSVGEDIPAEFNEDLFHHQGALAAARMPDQLNPEKKSSGSQFYIVEGKICSDSTLTALEQKTGKMISEDKKMVYKTIGGTPHLDGEYTVFGRVTSGMSVVDKISNSTTDRSNRPIKDIFIKDVTIRIDTKTKK